MIPDSGLLFLATL